METDLLAGTLSRLRAMAKTVKEQIFQMSFQHSDIAEVRAKSNAALDEVIREATFALENAPAPDAERLMVEGAPKQAQARQQGRGVMELRDEMAKAALAALLNNPNVVQANEMSGWRLVNCSPQNLADCCYSLADAMIERRASRPAPTGGEP
jgi:hypothetical protein